MCSRSFPSDLQLKVQGEPQPLSVLEPPELATGGPQLPPFLHAPRKRRDDDPVIVPDILRIDTQSAVYDRSNNWITTHYVWMNRMWGFFDRCEIAHVNSRRYHQWLETYEIKDGIPPHIQFGGAIVAGKGDPTFYARWVAYAQETFC